MRKIKLYDKLGEKFGYEFSMDVNSPAEAIRGLITQIDGLEDYLIKSEENGIGYKVLVSDFEIPKVDDLIIHSKGDIKIVPVITGANGEARVLIGAAMVATAAVLGAFTAGASTPFSSSLAQAGIALAVGGTLEILTRGMYSTSPNESPENKPSYSFAGAVNTTAQGHPVPVGYGKLIVGGAVISASLSTQSLLSGYESVEVVKYKDIYSYATIDNYQSDTPPPNYYTTQVLSYSPPSGDNSATWLIRYFWKETQLQLRTV